ncbi:MAG: response regulator transcription factor, partial [Thermoflexales bacterium]
EMLRGMAQGLSNREIARPLGLTPRTVDFHVGNILQKLGVVSRLEAVRWAKAHGFLGPVETYRSEPGNFHSRHQAWGRLYWRCHWRKAGEDSEQGV